MFLCWKRFSCLQIVFIPIMQFFVNRSPQKTCLKKKKMMHFKESMAIVEFFNCWKFVIFCTRKELGREKFRMHNAWPKMFFSWNQFLGNFREIDFTKKKVIPIANKYGFMPSGFLDVVRIEAKDDLCSGNRWYLIASKSNSLHSVFSLTKPSVSTWVIKNSRLINGSLTCFISCKKNSDILIFF